MRSRCAPSARGFGSSARALGGVASPAATSTRAARAWASLRCTRSRPTPRAPTSSTTTTPGSSLATAAASPSTATPCPSSTRAARAARCPTPVGRRPTRGSSPGPASAASSQVTPGWRPIRGGRATSPFPAWWIDVRGNVLRTSVTAGVLAPAESAGFAPGAASIVASAQGHEMLTTTGDGLVSRFVATPGAERFEALARVTLPKLHVLVGAVRHPRCAGAAGARRRRPHASIRARRRHRRDERARTGTLRFYEADVTTSPVEVPSPPGLALSAVPRGADLVVRPAARGRPGDDRERGPSAVALRGRSQDRVVRVRAASRWKSRRRSSWRPRRGAFAGSCRASGPSSWASPASTSRATTTASTSRSGRPSRGASWRG